MDLIYADTNKDELGVLKNYTLDLAFGVDENNFELRVTSDNAILKEDYLIYVEGTEYGGIIDAIAVDTKEKEIVYSGRTFHGILSQKVIEPSANTDYYIESGDANAIIGRVLSRVAVTDFFKAYTGTSVSLSSYQFDRYIDAYKGLRKMLASVGYKLNFAFENKKVTLRANPVTINSDEIDSDQIALKIKKAYNGVNHLICLGQGELKDRQVINLYTDEDGNISETKHFTNSAEITEVYDYGSVESLAELRAGGITKLKEYNEDSVELTLGSKYSFDIGDVITATENITGTVVTRKVTKKIVTIKNDVLSVAYKVEE